MIGPRPVEPAEMLSLSQLVDHAFRASPPGCMFREYAVPVPWYGFNYV